MEDKIKEILDLLNFNRDTISNGTCRVEDFMSRDEIIKLLDYITNLQEENEIIHKDLNELSERYFFTKSRCEKAQYLILHELSHLKANDETTWNKEFYDENNKLDYKKLCIELLNQIKNILNSGNKEN